MPVIRISLAQTSPVSAPQGVDAATAAASKEGPFHVLELNLEEARERIAGASRAGADVVVFPEYFLQGIVNQGRQYLTLPSEHLHAALEQYAKEYHVCVVGTIVHGFLPKESFKGDPLPVESPFAHSIPNNGAVGEKSGAHYKWSSWLASNPTTFRDSTQHCPNALVLHNTAFFIDKSGTTLGQYVKHNLWHPERHYLTPGKPNPATQREDWGGSAFDNTVFDTQWGRVGLLICWDISHPGAAQHLADQKVDIVFAPTYWLATDSHPQLLDWVHQPDYETAAVSALSFARAIETETVWVMCNAGGPAADGFMGGSAVWTPLRGRVGGHDGSEVGDKVIEIDLAVLRSARDLYKVQHDWQEIRQHSS